MNTDPQRVLHFWFAELSPKDWWAKNPDRDRQIAADFGTLHRAAAQAELYPWRDTATGRLAEIIVLDQFSRNIYRDLPQAFTQDTQALVLAQEALRASAHQALSPQQQAFLFMPFMHSESVKIHETAVQLYSAPGLEDNLNFELRHQAIIDRFGRYPHRNQILGRDSTPEELEFLQQPGSSF